MVDWIPKVGMEFETLKAAWKYWEKYGNGWVKCLKNII